MYMNNKKISLLFCKIRKEKNRMQLSAVCFNFAQHNNEQTLHTLKYIKEYSWGSFYPVNLIVYLTNH